MTNASGRNTRDPTSKPSCDQPRRVENNTLMQRTSRLAYNNHQIFITGFGSYVCGSVHRSLRGNSEWSSFAHMGLLLGLVPRDAHEHQFVDQMGAISQSAKLEARNRGDGPTSLCPRVTLYVTGNSLRYSTWVREVHP